VTRIYANKIGNWKSPFASRFIEPGKATESMEPRSLPDTSMAR
jgi:hypothetical protein